MTTKTITLTGYEAQDYALEHGMMVSKHADPIDNGGEFHPEDDAIYEALEQDPDLACLTAEIEVTPATIYTHNATIYERADIALSAMIEDWVTCDGTSHPADSLDNLNDLPETLDELVNEWASHDRGAEWIDECDDEDYKACIIAVRAALEADLLLEQGEDEAEAREASYWRANGQ